MPYEMLLRVLSEHRAQHPTTQWIRQQPRARFEHLIVTVQVVLDSRELGTKGVEEMIIARQRTDVVPASHCCICVA
jgi:hypothetical protein